MYLHHPFYFCKFCWMKRRDEGCKNNTKIQIQIQVVWQSDSDMSHNTYILQNALSCELLFHLKNKYSPWCGEREVSRGRHREWHSDRISSDPGSGDSAETAETPTTVTMWTMGHHLQPHLHCARVIVLGIGTCCCLLEFPSHAPSVFRLSRLATLSRSSKAVILLCPLIILIG